eukprot:TRINITY_DN35792_c0_g1_i1.p4 TRINITY_DN35792_c0_g1~~TRINITY_DN35792_c0_g1_i1.p4  ORF type:complete len:111 (-),score=7.27 TRINITY_DN35792_c0_g1_i1:384-716(-)
MRPPAAPSTLSGSAGRVGWTPAAVPQATAPPVAPPPKVGCGAEPSSLGSSGGAPRRFRIRPPRWFHPVPSLRCSCLPAHRACASSAWYGEGRFGAAGGGPHQRKFGAGMR